jgi:hypothetical protein
MGKKRFYETITPPEKTAENQTKKTRNKTRSGMANISNSDDHVNKINTQSEQNNHTVCNSQIFQTPGNGSYIMPPVYPVSQYMMNPGSPVMNPTQNIAGPSNNDVLQSLGNVMSKLQAIESKLGKLDSIQLSVEELTTRLNSMDLKINEIESSQKFISCQYDDILKSTVSNKSVIDTLQSEVRALSMENASLRTEREVIKEDVLDLKCRSMRDNMMFYGISEGSSLGIQSQPTQNGNASTSGEGQHHSDDIRSISETLHDVHGVLYSDVCNSEPNFANDNCEEKVHYFCANILKIPDVKNKVLIDRAHRIGKPTFGKCRPIVVKFKDTASKLEVKNALKSVNLKGTKFNVGEQYPQEIQQRRRDLIPKLIEARNQNKKAVLVRDKLFIDNKLYVSPQNGYHDMFSSTTKNAHS